jgi:ankyrin repeat protein
MGRLVARVIACAALFVVLPASGAQAGPEDDLRLLEAVKHRDTKAVAALLPVANVNAAQPDGATALHWAAHWDDLGLVQLLIRAKANVNAANDLGVTPLLVACADASPAVVSALLDAGANAKTKMPSGETALMMAARTGRAETVRALLLHGADVNARDTARQQTALMWAVAERHADVVRLLIESGADVQARSASRPRVGFIAGNRNGTGHSPESILANSREFDDGGYTALLLAAREDDAESAKLLLKGGARVDDTAASGTSALLVAVHSDSPHVATLLLEAGADPNADGAGYTPLQAAVLRGNLDVVKALLARGAQPNARITKPTPARRYGNEYVFGEHLVGTTPFYLAAKFGELDIMRALAAAGADTRAQGADGSTAIMLALDTPATRTGNAEGFGTDRRDRYGLVTAVTPEQVEGDALSIAKLAIELGGDVNQTDRDGNTALHLAASKGFNRIIQLLADNGAALNARNRKGQTALAAAEAATAVGAARRRMTGANQRVSDETASSTVALLQRLGASK